MIISAAMLAELSRREKAANVKPDPDIDIFMKVRTRREGEASILIYMDYSLGSFFNLIFFILARCSLQLPKDKKQVQSQIIYSGYISSQKGHLTLSNRNITNRTKFFSFL